MKRIFIGAIAAGMLALGACSTSTVDDTTQTISFFTNNLVTPLDGGAPFLTTSQYSCFFNMTKGVANLSTSDLTIDNQKQTFTTDTVPFKWYTLSSGAGVTQLIKVDGAKGNVNNNVDLPLGNVVTTITGAFYWNPTNIAGIDAVRFPGSMAFINYNIGSKYMVQTVQPIAFYCGTTHTSYSIQGAAKAFSTDKITYRVMLNLDQKKAEVVMYDAAFADGMPSLTCIRLKDLDFTLERGNYVISGANVVPQTPDAGSMTDNDSYVFESFNMTMTNTKLTNTRMDFEVVAKPMGNAKFTGQFNGSCLVKVEGIEQ